MPQQLSQETEAVVRNLQMIVGALMGGVTLFVFAVVFLFTASPLPGASIPSGIMIGIFTVMVAIQFAVAPQVARWLGRQRGGGLPSYHLETVVNAAVREGAGLFAIAITFLAGSPLWAAVFGVATVASISFGWPRLEDARVAEREARRLFRQGKKVDYLEEGS